MQRAKTLEAVPEAEIASLYPRMKVGQQVQK